MLIDTDVLIWCLRGNHKATSALSKIPDRWISEISRIELLIGCRNKSEVTLLKRFLADEKFQIAPLSQEIGIRATIYVEDFHLGHSIGMADALIAATATITGRQFFTANWKHFRSIPGLPLKRFTP